MRIMPLIRKGVNKTNLDEWKKSKVAEIEEVYATLKPFDVAVKRGDVFDDGVYVDLSPETFPYAKATSISTQFEGTGRREQYNLSIYCWIGSLKTCQQFHIKNDDENEKMISMLVGASKDIRTKITSTLKDDLSKFIKHEEKYARQSGGSQEYADYVLRNPLTQNKIRRAKEVIEALSTQK